MSQFTLSCTTCATRQPNKDEVSECFTHAPKAGYKAWGIAGPICWTPGLLQWVNTDELLCQANAVGLTQCTEVYGPAFPTDSIQAAQDAAKNLVLLFDLAEKLGSPLVVISGRKRTDMGLEATIAGIEALLPLIEDRPVKLALEPHYGAQIQYLEDYDAIFERIKTPQIGITLDSGHFHAAGVDWQNVIDKYTDRIYNFHVKDHIGTQSVAIGAGEVDLKAYISALHEINYEGALAVELEVEDFENLIRYGTEAYQ
ncbi:MAG: sugar phosphate isomerase/epimerase, partial [Chloroflexota bacterium]